MIAQNETKLTYRECTIRIVYQQKTLVIHWQSRIDGSEGHLQVSNDTWTDGEVVRLVMETIDRCCNQHQRIKNQRQA